MKKFEFPVSIRPKLPLSASDGLYEYGHGKAVMIILVAYNPIYPILRAPQKY